MPCYYCELCKTELKVGRGRGGEGEGGGGGGGGGGEVRTFWRKFMVCPGGGLSQFADKRVRFCTDVLMDCPLRVFFHFNRVDCWFNIENNLALLVCCMGPSIKDISTKSRKIYTPPPLVAACTHLRIFRKVQFFAPKIVDVRI